MNTGKNRNLKYIVPMLMIWLLIAVFTSACAGKQQTQPESSPAYTAEAADRESSPAYEESSSAYEESTYASQAAEVELSQVNGVDILAPNDEQLEELRKAQETVSEDGEYTSMAEVAAYIHLYAKLPSNFISKTKAKEQGWIQSEGNLGDVLPGKSIGGSRFYNDEGILPQEDGRSYTECDIDYTGGKRNAKRIVFSNDGLVFYTQDHYETYIQLY